MDVDGTLTDGKIYMGQNGELLKAFNVKDGCGISLILPSIDIIPVVITARSSEIVVNRCKEIGIREVYQSSKDKLYTLKQILSKYESTMDCVAYIGDDIPDIIPMSTVISSGGMALCPSDAIREIKDIATYVSIYRGGEGAVRDCIEYLRDNCER